MKNYKDILNSAALIILLILIDQSVKYMVRLSGGFYFCNKNLAFGIQIDSSVFYILWTFIIFMIVYLLGKQTPDWNHRRASFVFLLVGAFGNMLDRLIYGCVIDFIDLKFWPIFNLADVFITVGVIMLLLTNLKLKSKR